MDNYDFFQHGHDEKHISEKKVSHAQVQRLQDRLDSLTHVCSELYEFLIESGITQPAILKKLQQAEECRNHRKESSVDYLAECMDCGKKLAARHNYCIHCGGKLLKDFLL